MTTTSGIAENDLHDRQQPKRELARYTLRTSSGMPRLSDVTWTVVLSTDGSQIRRDVWQGATAWNAVSEGWEPEGIIWPTWPVHPADEMTAAEAALNGVQRYWSKSGNRLRDSAKWMATVLGAALATLAGTSPLGPLRQHHSPADIALLLTGLLLLCITLFLIVQVMRPQTVSFNDVQGASTRGGPFSLALGKWRATVESHQDLYLPCGVKCLNSLRQSLIIEKVTLMALARAKESEEHRGMRSKLEHHGMRKKLEEAQEARGVRLTELRHAAAQVAMIGEYYKLRSRSSRATYGGISCTLIGIAAITSAFTWPLA